MVAAFVGSQAQVKSSAKFISIPKQGDTHDAVPPSAISLLLPRSRNTGTQPDCFFRCAHHEEACPDEARLPDRTYRRPASEVSRSLWRTQYLRLCRHCGWTSLRHG